MTIIPVAIALVFLLVIISILLSNRGRSFINFCRMLVSGLESGFSLRQLFFLSKIGKRAGLEDRAALFWSSSALDKCTAEIVRLYKDAGAENNRNLEKILSVLYEYRRKMDLEQSRKKRGVTSTREIEVGQRLCVVFPGAGVFSSKVTANSSAYLTIDFPKSSSVMATDLDWNGKILKVLFWRIDDAGYEFSAKVIPSESGDSRALLRLAHSDNVVRSQMRKNRRIKCSVPAQLYIMENDASASEIETEPGMKCILKDLSATGAMILIGGKAFLGMKIKIQFMIQGTLIIMAGMVKGVNYDDSKNRSTINFECNKMNSRMKNEVLAFVYNVLPEIKKEPAADAEAKMDNFLQQQDKDELPDFAIAEH